MGKKKFDDEEKLLFEGIKGFTLKLESAIESRKRYKGDINLENITSMPTYDFVSLALSANSPRQVIHVIETIKKRYFLKLNFDRDAFGFLDSIEGKAYGYMALNIQDIDKQEKLYQTACKYFKSAANKGYVNAYLDLADLEEKFKGIYSVDELFRSLKIELPDTHKKMGELHMNFSTLVENAIRVMQGKRPFIEEDYSLPLALYHFKNGMKDSVECRVYRGLALIVTGEHENIEEGLKLVKDNLEEFKLKNKNIDKILFASDTSVFKTNVNLIENKLLKLNIR